MQPRIAWKIGLVTGEQGIDSVLLHQRKIHDICGSSQTWNG